LALEGIKSSNKAQKNPIKKKLALIFYGNQYNKTG